MSEISELLAHYVEAIQRSLSPVKENTTWYKGVLLCDPVRKAFLTVQRHRLLEGFYRWTEAGNYIWVSLNPEAPGDKVLEEIYTAAPMGLVTKLSPQGIPTSSTSSPLLMATMLEFLALEPGMKVLEIGAGTGYNAALMAEIVGKQELITTLEIQPDITERTQRLLRNAGYGGIQVHCADGFYGWLEEAPYDRIVGTTCCADISPHWFKQLSTRGWMLIPLRHGGETVAPLTQVYCHGTGRVLEQVGFGSAQGLLSDSGPWEQVSEPESASLDYSLPGRRLLRPPKGQFSMSFFSHFQYFAALNEPNMCFFWKPGRVVFLLGHRIHEIAEIVLDDEGWVKARGNKTLCECLEGCYREYEKSGQPRLQDYRIKFLMHSDTSEVAQMTPRVRRIGPREWLIKRRFTIQQVRLPS